MAEESYYSVLEVDPTASQEEIKRAYKKQSLRWHPDRVDPHEKAEATERFKKISEAYQILSDDVKRQEYDAAMRTGRPFQSFPFTSGMSAADLFNQEFKDLFGAVFSDIYNQHGDGSRIVSTVGWGTAGAAAGAVAGAIIFAPAIPVAAAILGVAGAIRGYTDKDLVKTYNSLDAETKRKVLNTIGGRFHI